MSVQIRLVINGLPAPFGVSQRVTPGQIAFAEVVGTIAPGATIQWFLISRPEFSVMPAGTGGAPLPVALGNLLTSDQITIDNDTDGIARDGTYVFGCLIGANLPPDQREFPRLGCYRIGHTYLDDAGVLREIRRPGVLERRGDVNVNVGWGFEFASWLDLIRKAATRQVIGLGPNARSGLMTPIDKSKLDSLSGSQVQSIPYICDPSVNLLDVVYLSSADTVDRADADGNGTQPVIGFVTDKSSNTSAIVQYHGEVSGFANLLTGRTYFLSTDPGLITPNAPQDPGTISQRLGFARNSTTLVLMVDRDYIQNN